MKWVLTSEQKFPTEEEQLENYKRNGNNEFLAVIEVDTRTGKQLHTVPVNLWDSWHPEDKVSYYYWETLGIEGEVVAPIKWSLMPDPCQVEKNQELVQLLFICLKKSNCLYQKGTLHSIY